MNFQPDYRYILDVVNNRRPARLPLYEHIISPDIMERILNVKFNGLNLTGRENDRREFFTQFCRFYKEMTYDTVSFEVCITEILPDSGAIMGGRPGPIQNRDDFEKYPWDELPELYWNKAKPEFDVLAECLPDGMKALGGVGNGVFEISEDLVGFEYLAYMMMSDPDLYAELHRKIGDLMTAIWARFLKYYSNSFAVCRFGDDLGFKTSTLISPESIKQHILPQYKRLIDLIHQAGQPFLWHSCGNIFSIMDDVIELGIDAKHSNEDAIAPYERWIKLYGSRIGLLGGIDVDLLCLKKSEKIFNTVLELGKQYRKEAKGFALGSGNSIPDYVPIDGYMAMIEAVQKIRKLENEKGEIL